MLLYTLLRVGFELTTSLVIGTDCIQNVGSRKFNYDMITAMKVPQLAMRASFMSLTENKMKTTLNK
jgi:hypothetical protein